jgi:RNA polymerase sigma factor for flagellar operon FliA
MSQSPERDALVAQYTEYAKSLVLDVSRNFPTFVRREDLMGVGIQGLVEAATRFDPTKGAHFKTFAYYRVRGAVIDFIRRSAQNDPYNRARASAAAAVDDAVHSQLGDRKRGTSNDAGDAATELSAVLDAAASVFTMGECAAALHSEAAVRAGEDPVESIGRQQEAEMLHKGLGKLPEKERFMLQAVYFEGRTIEQAGKDLGLSKSWASRLHARALQLTREAIETS